MAASHGHGPRHVLFLVTVGTLLSYAVGITATASLDHFTHFSNPATHASSRNWHRPAVPDRPRARAAPDRCRGAP
eukprot:1345738-Prymnesium_polylepis.1